MNYNNILEDDEREIFATRIHLFVLTFPIVFTAIFGLIFILGGLVTDQYLVTCIIMAVVVGMYPVSVVLLIINSRFIITNKRVIEQIGVFGKRQKTIYLADIRDISFKQSNFRRLIKCGDVGMVVKRKDKKDYFKVFKFIKNPHEFIVNLQLILNQDV